jgi:hypothetical protein
VGLDDPTGLETLLGKGKKKVSFLFEEFGLGLGLATEPAFQVLGASLSKLGIEVLETLDPRNRYEKVSPSIAQKVFYVTLFIGLPDSTELLGKKVMTLEPLKLPGGLAASASYDLRRGNLGVVVSDAPRYATEELKCPLVALLKGLGTLSRQNTYEDGVRVYQGHHEQGCLGEFTGHIDPGPSEVGLSMPWRMNQGNEDLSMASLVLPDGVFDDRIAPCVAVLVSKSLIDPFGRVTLLAMHLLIGSQDLVDDVKIWSELRLGTGLRSSVARRLRISEDLLEGLKVNAVMAKDRALTLVLSQHATTDVGPHLHVCVHPFLPFDPSDGSHHDLKLP